MSRGCGDRVEAGIYLISKGGPNGHPVFEYQVDPATYIDLDAAGIPSVGVHLRERADGSGVYDVWDVVGMDGYPNVSDFLEEANRMGISRRASKTKTNFGLLTRESRLMLVHRRGVIDHNLGLLQREPEQIMAAYNADAFTGGACPYHRRNQHCGRPGPFPHNLLEASSAMTNCARLYWQDLEPGDPEQVVLERSVEQVTPSVSYHGWLRPDDVKPKYRPGLFLIVPLTAIEVIRARDGSHRVGREQAECARGVPVRIMDE